MDPNIQKLTDEEMQRHEEAELDNFASLESGMAGSPTTRQSATDTFRVMEAFSGGLKSKKKESGTDSTTGGGSEDASPAKTSRLKQAVHKTMLMRQSFGALNDKRKGVVNSAQSILETLQDNNPNVSGEGGEKTEQAPQPSKAAQPFSAQPSKWSQTDLLIKGAMKVQNLLDDDDDDEDHTVASEHEVGYSSGEEIPLIPNRNNAPRRSRFAKLRRRLTRFVHQQCSFSGSLCLAIPRGIASAYCTFIAVPLFIAAWILYYNLGNPELDFLPGTVTLSWWCNFFGRHLITLELARIVQWFVIDVLTLQTKFTIKLLGPLFVLLAIQSKGWPFVVGVWGCIDLCMLHGDNQFPVHWLYWTEIKIYSEANSGTYILSSELYLRFLLSLVFAGVATSIKRTVVAVRFGRKTFIDFKPNLEKILQDVCLLAEVSELANAVESMVEEEAAASGRNAETRSQISEHDRKSVVLARQMQARGVGWVNFESVVNVGGDQPEQPGIFTEEPTSDEKPDFRKELSKTDSGNFKIKALLERWDEPVNKLQKTDASIRDVLRFRRALALMDAGHPFGDAFGDAATRDECIESASKVYWRLMKLTPGSLLLPFESIAMIAEAGDDVIKQENKIASLKKFFRPNRLHKVPLVKFVQSCDTLYRRLKYFRASVLNASAIDRVLEDMIDSVFGFVLFLIVMTLLNFNPWPLLVSMSTLLVSFSFAMGKSVSTWVEGVLMIAVQRPFGLGDRILVTPPTSNDSPGSSQSWLVEDINLYSTTLRLASTNEICTVRNGDLCSNRIFNLSRSPGAIIFLDLPLYISLLDGNNMEAFTNAVKNYVDNTPEDWETFLFVRITSIDVDNEQVVIRVAVRHRSSWHSATQIMIDRGELVEFISKASIKLGVDYCTAPSSRVHYQGGYLKSAYVSGNGKNVLAKDNLINFRVKED